MKDVVRAVALLLLCFVAGRAGVRFENGSLELDNGLIRRVSRFDEGKQRWIPVSMEIPTKPGNFLRGGGVEFGFSMDGEKLSGASSWKFAGWKPIQDERGGEGAAVTLQREGVSVEIRYWLYPKLPVLRKQLRITNTSDKPARLESVDVDSWPTSWSVEKGLVLRNYGRSREYSPLEGSWDDALVVAHDFAGNRGVAIGNEAPGVLKRTAVFQGRYVAEVGVTHAENAYPFRRWLSAGQSWESPKVFLTLYGDAIDPGEASWKRSVADFVREHVAVAWPVKPPLAIYDSWIPFLTNIREDLLEDLATRAARAGFDTFVVDYGWANNQGDWLLDRKKFPNGLKPIFDRLRQKGVESGIWMSIAMVDEDSEVHRQHPEWLVTDGEERPLNIHGLDQKMHSACMGTAWYQHIRGAIFRTVRDFDLRYLKLDFATTASAYIHQPERAGCRSKRHPGHRDREESMAVAYEKMSELADEIRREFPHLFLDITFEAWGKLQQIDYALIQHAHGDWLSNISELAPGGALQMRSMAWSRSAAIPAAAMIIGNLKTSDAMVDLNMASLAGAIPVVLGDLRLTKEAESARIRAWADWFRGAQAQHQIIEYRQDLRGFGEPAQGQWDGYVRMNTKTSSGGILGVFRGGSPEQNRRIFPEHLEGKAMYSVRSAPEDKVIAIRSGEDLMSNGIAITLDQALGAQVYELRRER